MRFFLLYLLLVSALFSEVKIELTQLEKEFLQNNQIIKIGTLKDFPPYDIVDKYNRYDGFNADILNAIRKYTGANLTVFAYDNWSEVYNKAINAQLHGIIGLSWSKQREENYFYYTDSYHYSPYSIIIHKNNNSIKTFHDLKEKRILVRKDSITETVLKNNFQDINMIYCDSVDKIYEKLKKNEGDAFLDSNPSLEMLEKYDLKVVTEVYNAAGELFIGIHHKYPYLYSIIQKGLQAIPLEETIEMRNKWFGKSLLLTDLNLNFVEQRYLRNKEKIKICSAEYAPFVMQEDEQYKGMSIDVFKFYEQVLGVPFEVITKKNHEECTQMLLDHEVDMSDSHFPTDKTVTTKPYMKDFLVLVTGFQQPYIDDLSKLSGVTISIGNHFADIIGTLKQRYPKIHFKIVDDYEFALKEISKKRIYGHIDLHKNLAWMIKNYYLGQLKISGVLPEFKIEKVFELNTDPNSAKLMHIMTKLINATPQSKLREISNSWVNVTVNTGYEYKLIVQLILLFLSVLIIILYFNYQLKKKVQIELAKNQAQQQMLFQQAKLASMGEMLNNIAHQWRQPLNRINSNVAVINLVTKDDRITQKMKDIERNTKYMSETIDDFSNFFQPNKIKENFSVVDAIYKANNLIKNRMKQVLLELDYQNDAIYKGYEKEFIQVMLTIISNALDNFTIQKTTNPSIKIIIFEEKESIFISIEDNGGGIPEDIISKVFDPYFTTKGLQEGKGVGLYMSKMICENSMNGMLSVTNTQAGAKFLIELKK